jgi:hypothetical protein
LIVAQEYLTRLFPSSRAFRFRPFDSHDGIASELRDAQIIFLTPNQLELLPPLEADLFVNISSLHEMPRRQIDNYFRLIDIHTEGIFYTKQWRKWRNPDDEVTLEEQDYPVRASWRVVFQRRHGIHPQLFEAAYSIRRALMD